MTNYEPLFADRMPILPLYGDLDLVLQHLMVSCAGGDVARVSPERRMNENWQTELRDTIKECKPIFDGILGEHMAIKHKTPNPQAAPSYEEFSAAFSKLHEWLNPNSWKGIQERQTIEKCFYALGIENEITRGESMRGHS